MQFTIPIYPSSAHFQVEGHLGDDQFACDLGVCKGACCTMPAERGAPVLSSEIGELERVFPAARKYLSDDALDAISEQGIWKKELDGTYTIPTVRGADCVFVHWKEDIAFCSIQTAFHNGEIQRFEKPISCHLFPLRIYPEVEENTFFICYEEIDECRGGRARGEKERVPLLEFLKHPLARALGDERRDLLMRSFKNL